MLRPFNWRNKHTQTKSVQHVIKRNRVNAVKKEDGRFYCRKLETRNARQHNEKTYIKLKCHYSSKRHQHKEFQTFTFCAKLT